MTWADVARVHRTHGGVAIRDGVAFSLLCSDRTDSIYQDIVRDGEILYNFGSRYPTKAGEVHFRTISHALSAAKDSRSRLLVFRKNGVNDWSCLGEFVIERIDSVDTCRIVIRLVLA